MAATGAKKQESQPAEFRANWNKKCEVCGEKPTVDIIPVEGKPVKTGLCGVCTWGEADCADPENW